MDIKRCLSDMREDEEWILKVREHQKLEEKKEQKERIGRKHSNDVLELIELIERGFEDIEHRIANMDKEHSKYVRATVSRLNYLLREEDDKKGLLVQLLNKMGSEDSAKMDGRIRKVSSALNLSGFDILHESPLYKRRKPRKFEELVEVIEEQPELDRADVLKLNQIQRRFSRQEIEAFVDSHMVDGIFSSSMLKVEDDETFEKLILAYDQCMRKNSRFEVRVLDKQIIADNYQYPELVFLEKSQS